MNLGGIKFMEVVAFVDIYNFVVHTSFIGNHFNA
jgi:hypothetical protein